MHEFMSHGTSRITFDIFNSIPFNTSYFIKNILHQKHFFLKKRFVTSALIHCFMQQKQQTWKVIFCYHHKKDEKICLSIVVKCLEASLCMQAKKKYFRKRRRHGQSILFRRSDVTNTSRECIGLCFLGFQRANFRSEMKESVTNKPFVCFPFSFPFILLFA